MFLFLYVCVVDRDVQVRDDITPYTSPVFVGVGVVLSDITPKGLTPKELDIEDLHVVDASACVPSTASSADSMVNDIAEEVDSAENPLYIAEAIPVLQTHATPQRHTLTHGVGSVGVENTLMPVTPATDTLTVVAVAADDGLMPPPRPPVGNSLSYAISIVSSPPPLVISTPNLERTSEFVEAFSYVNTPQTIVPSMHVSRELVIPSLPQRVELEEDEADAISENGVSEPVLVVPLDEQDIMNVIREPSASPLIAPQHIEAPIDGVGAVANLFQTEMHPSLVTEDTAAENIEEATILEEEESFCSEASVFEDIVEVEDVLEELYI